MICRRLYGGSVRQCACMLPDKGGFLECPPEARGADRWGILAHVVPAVSIFPSTKSYAPAAVEPLRLTQTGEMCQSCGAFALVRTGTCLTCQVCHESSGGCS